LKEAVAMQRAWVCWIGALAALAAAGCATAPRPTTVPAKPVVRSAGRTVADVLATLGPAAERRLRARFATAGVAYPPRRAHLLAFKAERRLELWATGGGRPTRVAVYPLLAESGTLGPKLREGDYQIPEGVYRVVWLHPNSAYHLSMKLDYPNAFDRARAREEGRTNLGGDIFIHGGDLSIGCLAVGDPAIEELFVLAARIGVDRVTTVVAPWDLRRRPSPELPNRELPWLPGLYARLSSTLAAFR
jgi:hypothetical protein